MEYPCLNARGEACALPWPVKSLEVSCLTLARNEVEWPLGPGAGKEKVMVYSPADCQGAQNIRGGATPPRSGWASVMAASLCCSAAAPPVTKSGLMVRPCVSKRGGHPLPPPLGTPQRRRHKMLNTIMDMAQYWLLVAAVVGLLLTAEKDWKKWARTARSRLPKRLTVVGRSAAPVKT